MAEQERLRPKAGAHGRLHDVQQPCPALGLDRTNIEQMTSSSQAPSPDRGSTSASAVIRNVGAAARQLHPGIGERAFPQGPFALVVLIELDRQQLDQRILDPHGSLLPGGDGTISRRLRCYRQGGTALLYARPSRIGRIAQLVEQLTLNQRVAGSSPAAPTKLLNHLPPSLAGRFSIRSATVFNLAPRRFASRAQET